MNATPRRVRTWGLRVLAISGPAALLVMAAWAFELLPTGRPNLVLMVYMLLLSVAMSGALAACAAACHMAVARAFSIGLRTGQELGRDTTPPQQPGLRLVE